MEFQPRILLDQTELICHLPSKGKLHRLSGTLKGSGLYVIKGNLKYLKITTIQHIFISL